MTASTPTHPLGPSLVVRAASVPLKMASALMRFILDLFHWLLSFFCHSRRKEAQEEGASDSSSNSPSQVHSNPVSVHSSPRKGDIQGVPKLPLSGRETPQERKVLPTPYPLEWGLEEKVQYSEKVIHQAETHSLEDLIGAIFEIYPAYRSLVVTNEGLSPTHLENKRGYFLMALPQGVGRVSSTTVLVAANGTKKQKTLTVFNVGQKKIDKETEEEQIELKKKKEEILKRIDHSSFEEASWKVGYASPSWKEESPSHALWCVVKFLMLEHLLRDNGLNINKATTEQLKKTLINFLKTALHGKQKAT